MSARDLSAIERNYFVSKAGGATTQEPLGQLKRRYYASYVNATGKESFNDLESAWQTKVISDNGGTPSSIYASDLWKEMVVAIGATPGKTTTENKKIFYIENL